MDSDNFPELVLSGKTTREITIHDRKYKVLALDELQTNQQYDLIIHFAFVTQEKLSHIGSQNYIDENMRLNRRIQEIAYSAGKTKKLIISSGAAALYRNEDFAGTSKGIYGELKRDLEDRFLDSDSLILRLWTTSGHHLGYNPNYAISEFIYNARLGKDIHIRENVSRSYVASQEIVSSSINYLLGGGSGTVNSGGEITTLSNLAERIVLLTNSKSKVLSDNYDPTHLGNFVSPESEIPQTYWTKKSSLDVQILEIMQGPNFNQIL